MTKPEAKRKLFALQFATGMRFGEIAGLHIEDLDFVESVIRIRRSTFGLQEVTPKSQAGHRQIDVDPDTMTMVKEYLGDRQSGRVFQTKNETPLVVNNVNRRVLKPLCKKLEIPIGTTHAFRHGRISVLQQNNVPGDLIKKWVGHTSLKTTSKYTHSRLSIGGRSYLSWQKTGDHGPNGPNWKSGKWLMYNRLSEGGTGQIAQKSMTEEFLAILPKQRNFIAPH